MKSLLLLSGLGVLALLAEIFNLKKRLYPVVLIGLLVTIAAAVKDWNTNIHYYSNMMLFDNFAITFTVLICVVALLWFVMSQSYFTEETNVTDHFALVLFSLVGAVCMVSYNNMAMLFLGIEILSLSLYVMAGSKKNDLLSNEAALKYFLMGSFATGFLLFGIALIYGASGSFHLSAIAYYISENQGHLPTFFYAGVLLMLVGMAFKVSAAPFHFWAPDVYQGSPTVVTAFMATIVKTAAFAAFFRLFATCFMGVAGTWTDIVSVMCILTLIVGNITAVFQESTKRMLAFSSVAHAGYMLLAIVSLSAHSGSNILYYTAAYSVATIASFTVLYNVMQGAGDAIESFNGLSKRNPFAALVMAVALLSLAGIPPMAGFFGKYYLFTSALEAHHIWLVLVAVFASLVGVYYYFKILIAMYFKPAKNAAALSLSGSHQLLLVISLLLMLLMGAMPDWIIRLI
ncbi:MAG: NADH-quinone oxidoreductase subunit N [Bacteroidetes bacterium]|nr:NADH-quinone oxidoreductase subunit N [Bacteroidota bacterium]